MQTTYNGKALPADGEPINYADGKYQVRITRLFLSLKAMQGA